jgi:membrane protein DedA with SNARE-associated domain
MKEVIHQYGAWIVFALVFLESIGLPLPGEAILVSAAIFAGTTQQLGIAVVLLSAVLGAIVGSTIGFWVGDRYGYPLLLRYGSYVGLTETRIKIAQYLFRRQGMVVVLIARFVATARECPARPQPQAPVPCAERHPVCSRNEPDDRSQHSAGGTVGRGRWVILSRI